MRNLEDYFKYLLRVIRPTPVLEGGRFHRDDTTVAVLSRSKCFFLYFDPTGELILIEPYSRG